MSKIAALTPRRKLTDASDVDWFWGIETVRLQTTRTPN